MKLKDYIKSVRGSESIRSFSKTHNIPIKTISQYETEGYLDNASPTIISNLCKCYNIDPHNLPNFGYYDPDFVDTVLHKLDNFSYSSERDYCFKSFLTNFSKILNISDKSIKDNSTHYTFKDQKGNNYIVYYLPTLALPKGQKTFVKENFIDYYSRQYDSIQRFANNESNVFFFITSSMTLYYAMSNKRNNIKIGPECIKTNTKNIYTSYLIYSRYASGFNSNNIFRITGNELFFVTTDESIHKNKL